MRVRVAIAILLLATLAPAAPKPAANRVVVIVAKDASGRGVASPRALRRIVAARRGRVALANGYSEVSLWVSKIVSGTLDDPDYANRPIGVNTLPVVLLDDAAYAAPSDMDGFGGTWRLTRLDDGTLVASAIGDTPWPAARAAGARKKLAEIRSGLHAASPERRITALHMLWENAFYELVPDTIALLDDTREVPAPPAGYGDPTRAGVVHDFADRTLRRLVAPLADAATPTADTRKAWDAYWKIALARTFPAPTIVSSATTDLATLAMNQSWPELAATGDGTLVFGFTRLDGLPLDGHKDGIAVFDKGTAVRTYLATDARTGLDAASGPSGVGVLSGYYDAPWRLTVGGNEGEIIATADKATHAAVAPADKGFVVAYIKDKISALFVRRADGAGRPAGAAVSLALPAEPNARFHRGIHPVALARRKTGWVAAIDTRSGVLVAELDGALALVGTEMIGDSGGEAAQPKLAVAAAGDRALVAWRRGGNTTTLATAIVGQPQSLAETGSDVALVSRPVALDDGFAIAWIEVDDELHVGRWSADGKPVASAVVEPRGVASFALALARDGDAVVVTYEDVTRYPYHLVSRRIALGALR